QPARSIGANWRSAWRSGKQRRELFPQADLSAAGLRQQLLDSSAFLPRRLIGQGRLELPFRLGLFSFLQPGGAEVVAKGRLVRPLIHQIRENLNGVIIEILLQIDPGHGVGNLVNMWPLLPGPLREGESCVEVTILLRYKVSQIVQRDRILRLQ